MNPTKTPIENCLVLWSTTGSGSGLGLGLEISSTLAFPSRISISGLSVSLSFTSIIRLVCSTRGADYQTEFGQRSVNPFGSLATPLEFSSRACLAWLIVNWEQQKSRCCCCGSLEETPQLAQMAGLRGHRSKEEEREVHRGSCT